MRCFAFVAVVLLASGCSTQERPAAAEAQPSRSASAVADPTSAPSLPGTAIATASAPSPVEQVTEMTAFASPTGNILCVIDSGWASCVLREQDWDVPPKAADCDGDWGPDIEVRAAGAASFRCASDAAPYAWTTGKVLAYGRAIRAGNAECVSARSDMQCKNLRTGHGFTVSRSRFELR